MQYQLDFKTQYNQFYIADKSSLGETDKPTFWSDEAYDDRLALGKGIIGIGTECYGSIRGDISLLERANNNYSADEFDHIVEGGLKIDSGNLNVLNCPTSELELEIHVKPGVYRVRIYTSNLESADIDEDKGDDYYKIEIWPDSNMERKVLKQYIPNK
jgi:hypothetical protein